MPSINNRINTIDTTDTTYTISYHGSEVIQEWHPVCSTNYFNAYSDHLMLYLSDKFSDKSLDELADLKGLFSSLF